MKILLVEPQKSRWFTKRCAMGLDLEMDKKRRNKLLRIIKKRGEPGGFGDSFSYIYYTFEGIEFTLQEKEGDINFHADMEIKGKDLSFACYSTSKEWVVTSFLSYGELAFAVVGFLKLYKALKDLKVM